jgi:peptidase M23-like protein
VIPPRMHAFTSTLVALSFLAAPRGDEWTPIEKTTFEQREAADPRAGRASEELLVLPFASAAPNWPPCFVVSGEPVARSPEPLRVVDRMLPRKPIHDDYLKQRELLAAQPMKLIEWCRKNGLDECAEFEAARRMDEIDDFRKPEYAPFLKVWLDLRDRQSIRVCLPLPLEGEWFVLKDSSDHHRKKDFAAYAFDLVVRVGDRQFQGEGTRLEDFYAFGRPIVAQADGVVISVDDGFPDNAPGRIAGFDQANDVVVDYGGGLLALYAHCRHKSAKVRAGERVRRGTELAEVGNSGASALPHLHFTMMDWGYLSIRGRFRGEMRRGESWLPFEGRNLELGSYVRNASEAPPPAHR